MKNFAFNFLCAVVSVMLNFNKKQYFKILNDEPFMLFCKYVAFILMKLLKFESTTWLLGLLITFFYILLFWKSHVEISSFNW